MLLSHIDAPLHQLVSVPAPARALRHRHDPALQNTVHPVRGKQVELVRHRVEDLEDLVVLLVAGLLDVLDGFLDVSRFEDAV